MVNSFFLYVIPLADEDLALASPYQGFTKGILGCPPFIGKILECPQNILELCSSRDKIISFRMCGGSNYQILPIYKDLLNHIPISCEKPFICIFSDEETYSDTIEFIKRNGHPILHISTRNTKEALNLSKVRRTDFIEYTKRVIEHISPNIDPSKLLIANELLDKMTPWKKENSSLKRRFHLITLPNEITLTSLGFRLNDGKQLVGYDDTPYIQAIIESTDAIINERRKILESDDAIFPFPPAFNLIITTPSMYKHIYKHVLNNKEHKDKMNYRLFGKIHKLLKRQTGYSIKSNVKEMKEIFSSRIGQYIFQLRKEETLAYTSAISVKASNNFCPTIRLPPEINTLHHDLKRLADCARAKNYSNKTWKMNKLCRLISERLFKIIRPAFIERIDIPNNQIKLITDAPLEWLPIRGLPLVLRCDVSRIPTTPGNLFFQQCLIGEQMILPMQAFEEVLIIRSFDGKDPIKNVLKSAIDTIKKPPDLTPLIKALEGRGKENAEIIEALKPSDKRNPFSVKIRWVDVSNINEFIYALNAFSGAVMIYDGHGVYETENTIGSLKIGNNKLDTWELKGKARIPPIILLSACDTHSIDSSHASVANGFLLAGATTVLATILPINALRAAVFIARMILRMEQFLPIITQKLGHSIRWTNVVSGLQRMSFISESLIFLNRKANLPISTDAYLRIHSKTNNLINTLHADWYEQYIHMLSQETGKSVDVIKQLMDIWVKIPECIKYIQLGNPELILIGGNDINLLLQASAMARGESETIDKHLTKE